MSRRRAMLVAGCVVALSCLAGCASSGSRGPEPVSVPHGAKLIAYGKYENLVLSAPDGGTLFFVDDATGEVVYVMPVPAGERDIRLSDAPHAFKEMFKPDHKYRIYLVGG